MLIINTWSDRDFYHDLIKNLDKYIQIDEKFIVLTIANNSFCFLKSNVNYGDLFLPTLLEEFYGVSYEPYKLNPFLISFYYNFLKSDADKILYRFLLCYYKVKSLVFDGGKEQHRKFIKGKSLSYLPKELHNMASTLMKLDTLLHSYEDNSVQLGKVHTFLYFRIVCDDPIHRDEISWNHEGIGDFISNKNSDLSIIKELIDYFFFREKLKINKPNVSTFDRYKSFFIKNKLVKDDYDWVCPKCELNKASRKEALNSLGKACPNCRISLSSTYCPNCGTKAVIPNYCNQCQKEVTSNFCRDCGNEIVNINNSDNE